MGIKNCPHYQSGECDGHIDKESVMPELHLDEDQNVEQGCLLEVLLNIMGTSIKDISIGRIRPLRHDELFAAVKALK